MGQSGTLLGRRSLARCLCLLRSALCRFFRLHGYGTGRGTHPRLSAADQLSCAISGAHADGVLALLACLAIDLDPAPPVHTNLNPGLEAAAIASGDWSG